MDKKTRNIVIAVIAVIVVALAIWLIAGSGNKPAEPAATEAPAVTEAATEAPTEAPAKEEAKPDAEEKAEEVKEEAKTATEEKVEEKKEAVKEDVKTLAADIKDAAGAIKEDVKEKAEDVKAAVEEKAEDIKATVEEKAEDIKEKAEDVKAAIEEKTEEVKAAVEEKAEEIKAAAEGAEVAAEDETKSLATVPALSLPQLKPMTVKEKVTLNKENVSAVAGMLFQGDKGKIEKLNQLIDFVNDMEYTVLYDGVDAEAFVSVRGEDLASALVLRSDDGFQIYSDTYPSYYVNLKKEDLKGMGGENFQMPANVDPSKLMQAFTVPVMKMLSGVKFGEVEKVEETMFDTVFTAKTPINMTLKEMALLGLNTVKEIMDNEEVAKILDGLKDKGVKISVSDIDEAIKSVEASKDEEVPDVDAGMYTNEKNDMVFKVDVTQDGKMVSHSVGGKVGNSGVSEVQIGDQMYTNVQAGKEGVHMVIRVSGMEIGIDALPEKRENGIAYVATVSFMKMEMAKIEVEKINDGILTGKFNIDGKQEITLKDLKEQKTELIKAVYNDAKTNYLPALKEKIQKIAPEMMSLFSSAKKLVKNAPQMIPQQMLPAQPAQ